MRYADSDWLLCSFGPLDREQQSVVVKDYLAANPDPLAVVEGRHPKMVRRARRVGLTADELYSSCIVGLAYAARVWNPERGPFEKLAVFWMRGKVGRDANTYGRVRRLKDRPCVGLGDVVDKRVGGHPCRAADLIFTRDPAPWSAVEFRDSLVFVLRVIAAMSAADVLLLSLRYGVLLAKRPRTFAEIAELYGITRQAAEKAVKKAEQRVIALVEPTNPGR